MDPISISATMSGLVIAIEQIVGLIYKYGKGVRDARKEINQLCSELFALKAALEHIKMSTESTLDIGEDDISDSSTLCDSTLFGTLEFQNMLSTTESLLTDLAKRLDRAPGRLNSVLHNLTWPLKKDDIKSEVQRLERLKSYFILATATDNL